MFRQLLCVIGIWLFVKGFLLNRRTSTKHSLPNESYNDDSNQFFNQTLILLVDALRFDFAIDLPLSKALYHNQFTVRNLTANDKDDWLMFHSVADAPTTTLQRLQALLTGGLPVFIDASSNFQSTGNHLQEDNLIHQLLQKQHSLLFVGDDTWMGLFDDEHAFHQQTIIPYPSLNVMDLDTVDWGCLMHLNAYYGKQESTDVPDGLPAELNSVKYTEMLQMHKTRNATSNIQHHITIAHLLGVDHCGHRYGADHPIMHSKLAFLHKQLQTVISQLPPKTLLVILSDHGMDNNGDHGGDSDLERDAFLGVHLTGTADSLLDRRFFEGKNSTWQRLQVKMAARGLSQQKGRNGFTGSSDYPIIDQIDIVPTLALLHHTPIPFSNLGSLIPQLFLRAYASSVSSDSSASSEYEWKGVENLLNAAAANAQQISEYLEEIGSHDSQMPVSGLLQSYRDTRNSHSVISNGSVEEALEIIAEYFLFMRQSADMARSIWARFDLNLISIGLISILLSFIMTARHLSSLGQSYSIICVLVISACHWAVFASNSFIVWEDSLTFYLLQSLLIVAWLFTCQTAYKTKINVLFIAALIICRIGYLQRLCREEQGPTCQSTFMSAAPLIVFDTLPLDYNYLISASNLIWIWFLFFCLFFFRRHFSRQLSMSLFIVALHWSVEYLDERYDYWSASNLKIAIIQFQFISSFLVAVYRYFNSNFNSFLILFDFAFSLLLTLMLPSGIWSLVLVYMLMLCLRSIYSCIMNNPSKLLIAFTAVFAGWQSFFWTGHQATFSSIPFQVGLFGLEETDFYFSGLRLIWNILGPFCVCLMFALVMLLSNNNDDSGKMKRVLVAVLQLYWTGLLLSSCAMTAYFRRHLMVWKVFTPRLLLTLVHYLAMQFSLLIIG